jgi:hypothetical protein
VVPARLGKGGWLFPFLARTFTLPDDVELLGALTNGFSGAAVCDIARRSHKSLNSAHFIKSSRRGSVREQAAVSKTPLIWRRFSFDTKIAQNNFKATLILNWCN